MNRIVCFRYEKAYSGQTNVSKKANFGVYFRNGLLRKRIKPQARFELATC